MNDLRIQHNLTPVFLGERRKSERLSEINLLLVSSQGTGKILDINQDGLSFGCLYPQTFPEVFTLDIINARGLHLKQATARKTWQRTRGDTNLSTAFEMEVGVEFLNLHSAQETILAFLLIDRLQEGQAFFLP
jgi:hypothetical protein